jgi:beta-N-acetylhexosaminidase
VAKRTRAIYGCLGRKLSATERAFFRQAQPWGFILFARNVLDREQVRELVRELREVVDDVRAPVLIDQEGGRVMRLRPPQWRDRPAGRRFGELYAMAPEPAREAAYLNARLIAHDLAEVGISVDCMPVLDIPVRGASDVIGDRALSSDPSVAIELGRAEIEGLLDGGILPVMKHVPGHGRANADSHFALPRVSTPADELSSTDFVPFRGLSDCPLAMTAHVVYEAIDPHRPATTSPKIISRIVRGEIGFEGVLLSDDLSMKALSGSLADRARAALFAGCDIALHCNGDLDEMEEVAREAKPLERESLRRAERALAQQKCPEPFDTERAESRVLELLGVTA